MKSPRLAPGILCALSFSVALPAQVPPDYLVLALKGPTPNATAPAILFIDPVTGTASPVTHASSGPGMTSVSAVTAPGSNMYVVGATGGNTIPPLIWNLPLAGNEHASITPFSASGLSLNGIHKIAATGQGLVFTIQGGPNNGLYYLDLTTNKVTVGTAVPAQTALAGNVVVIGTRAYAAFYNTSSTARRGMIYEWVLGGTAKPVLVINDQNPPMAMTGATSILGGPSAWLHIANDTGGVSWVFNINATGWVSVPILALNLSGIGGLAVDPQWSAVSNSYYLAVTNGQGGTDVFYYGGALTKVFTDPRPFGDLGYWTGSLPQGGVLFYGKGCAGSSTGTPRMVHSSYPTRGTGNFAIAMSGGPANAACLFAMGRRRTGVSLASIGAPGCSLHTDLLVVLARSTTNTGTASISVNIPNTPNLLRAHVFAQCGIADQAANAAGLITTQGVEYIVY